MTRFKLPEIYEKFSSEISIADFIVIAAEAMMGRTATSYRPEPNYFDEGTLARTFLDGFKFGRKTSLTCKWSFGRMPSPENGCYGYE